MNNFRALLARANRWLLPDTPDDLAAEIDAALAQPAQAPIDADALISACLPGGYRCDPQRVADRIRAYLVAQPAQAPALPSVDDLAQYIRRINGHHKMGAGALAESLVGWMRAQAPAQPAPQPDDRLAPGDPDFVRHAMQRLREGGLFDDPPSTAEAVERAMELIIQFRNLWIHRATSDERGASYAALRSAVEAMARGEQ